MSRYDPYSRRALRTLFRNWVKRNGRTVGAMSAIAVVVLVFETFTILMWSSSAKWYLLGIVHSAVIAGFIYILSGTFLAHDRAAIWHLRGAWGEDATRSELRQAKRKGLIWGSIDSVDLQVGDLDHLVVTRQGGLVVIDSKWRTEAVTDPSEMARSAAKVQLRAEGLARTLLPAERGSRHRANGNTAAVLPVVVLWGPAQHELPDNAESSGIEFVAGKGLIAWIGRLEGTPIDKHAAKNILRQLEAFRASAWARSVV